MTERERIRDEDVRPGVGVYDTTNTARTPLVTTNTYDYDDGYDDDRASAEPTDLIRWGPVIAGLFAALATLVTLSVLGLAIGLSSYDAGDPARTFEIGAGIWGAISALIAFGVGGWLAGRTAAVRGRSSGILQGAMVWFVTIPLLLYLLGSGIGALARTAGGVASTAAEIAAPAAGQAAGAAANNPALQATAQAGAQNLGQAAQATAQALGSQVTPQAVEQAADTAGRTAWGTLLSLGLAAAAAIGGGYLGAQQRTPARTVRT